MPPKQSESSEEPAFPHPSRELRMPSTIMSSSISSATRAAVYSQRQPPSSSYPTSFQTSSLPLPSTYSPGPGPALSALPSFLLPPDSQLRPPGAPRLSKVSLATPSVGSSAGYGHPIRSNAQPFSSSRGEGHTLDPISLRPSSSFAPGRLNRPPSSLQLPRYGGDFDSAAPSIPSNSRPNPSFRATSTPSYGYGGERPPFQPALSLREQYTRGRLGDEPRRREEEGLAGTAEEDQEEDPYHPTTPSGSSISSGSLTSTTSFETLASVASSVNPSSGSFGSRGSSIRSVSRGRAAYLSRGSSVSADTRLRMGAFGQSCFRASKSI